MILSDNVKASFMPCGLSIQCTCKLSLYACLWLWHSGIHKRCVHTLQTQNTTPCVEKAHMPECLPDCHANEYSTHTRSCQQGMHTTRHITEESKQQAQSCHRAEKACTVCSLSTGSFSMHTKTTHTPRRKHTCAFVGGQRQGVQP